MRKSKTEHDRILENDNIYTEEVYRPFFFNLNDPQDALHYNELREREPGLQVVDTIERQLEELLRIKYPADHRPDKEDAARRIREHTGAIPIQHYGVWVYYPWLKKIVHLLDREEFILVRTNRNMYKITPDEIKLLGEKKIGIIGLSVGQSIAVTLAMERVCGALHLADPDVVDLSNMNRLNVGVSDIGTNKAVLAARKIAEIDPFINITCFKKGVSNSNIHDFLSRDGKLDLLVEECDSIDVKLTSRLTARKMGIPVVMDTNDKGMLDVERFDLEPGRPLLHGRVPDFEQLGEEQLEATLSNMTTLQKVEVLAAIIGMENVSDEMKRSLPELNKTISGWPQLASAVMLGGAMVTDVCRSIFTGKFSRSGRYFVDFRELIINANPAS